MEQADVNILIVDDVNVIRTQLKEVLKSFGFRKIRSVAHAEEAKIALIEESFQVILCDWHMTPTTGIDFLKYVRQHPEHKNIAFIMVTAEATREKVLEAIQSGIDDYIVKPLTLASVSKVHKVLLKRQVIT